MAFYIKNKIIQRLNDDVKFRVGLAAALEVSERSVYDIVKKSLVKSISNSTFTKKAALVFFEENGYKEEDFLTNNKPVV